jgi:hypothetical protein
MSYLAVTNLALMMLQLESVVTFDPEACAIIQPSTLELTMTRKQHKAILNYAAANIGRKEAKAQFGNRDDFGRVPKAFYHKTTFQLFVI